MCVCVRARSVGCSAMIVCVCVRGQTETKGPYESIYICVSSGVCLWRGVRGGSVCVRV